MIHNYLSYERLNTTKKYHTNRNFQQHICILNIIQKCKTEQQWCFTSVVSETNKECNAIVVCLTVLVMILIYDLSTGVISLPAKFLNNSVYLLNFFFGILLLINSAGFFSFDIPFTLFPKEPAWYVIIDIDYTIRLLHRYRL